VVNARGFHILPSSKKPFASLTVRAAHQEFIPVATNCYIETLYRILSMVIRTASRPLRSRQAKRGRFSALTIRGAARANQFSVNGP